MTDTATDVDEKNDVDGVELIDQSDLQLDESSAADPVEHRPLLGPRMVGVVAGAIIVLALAILSRPTERVTLPPPQTAASTVPDPAPTSSIPGADSGQEAAAAQQLAADEPPVTLPIPMFDSNVPEDVPGVLVAVDSEGSLLVIDRTTVRPDEKRLGMTITNGNDRPQAALSLPGASVLEVDRELELFGDPTIGADIIVPDPDLFEQPSFNLTDLIPETEATTMLVDHGPESQTVTLVPPGWDGNGDELVTWAVRGLSISILGPWDGGVIAEQAGRVWLLGPGPQAELVAEGQVLAFDGRFLTRLLCPAPDQCQLAVGPPDDADARLVDVPPELASLPIADWATSLTISPDGRMLGTSVRFGGLSLPTIVDLDTGAATSLADGMNREAPVAWSPDGQWLAYAFDNDVMVWNLEEGRSWRIKVNRRVEWLAWN